jgi:hypothetical protein
VTYTPPSPYSSHQDAATANKTHAATQLQLPSAPDQHAAAQSQLSPRSSVNPKIPSGLSSITYSGQLHTNAPMHPSGAEVPTLLAGGELQSIHPPQLRDQGAHRATSDLVSQHPHEDAGQADPSRMPPQHNTGVGIRGSLSTDMAPPSASFKTSVLSGVGPQSPSPPLVSCSHSDSSAPDSNHNEAVEQASASGGLVSGIFNFASNIVSNVLMGGKSYSSALIGGSGSVGGGGGGGGAPVIHQLLPSIEKIFHLFDRKQSWTHTEAVSAQHQLPVIRSDCLKLNPDKLSMMLQALCERSQAFLTTVVKQQGPLGVIPLFAFFEELCSTLWGASRESSGGKAKMQLRSEFIRVLSLVNLDSDFVACVWASCNHPSLREQLYRRAGLALSNPESKWPEDQQFCVLVTMIRALSDNSKADAISKVCKCYSWRRDLHDSDVMRLFKERQFSPFLYRELVLASIDQIKSSSPITHLVWFNGVITAIMEVASGNLREGPYSQKEFMLVLLKTISNRHFLDAMRKIRVLEVPPVFLGVFEAKMLLNVNKIDSDKEASEFSQFLVTVCEFLCQCDDACTDNLLFEMFVRPLCDLKCQNVLTRNKSGRASSVEVLLNFHALVSERTHSSLSLLKQASPSHNVNYFAVNISEVWESAVWKLLQSRMDDLSRNYERDITNFTKILPKSAARTSYLCCFLQVGVRNLFNTEKFDDPGAIAKLGAVWVHLFDSHANSPQILNLSWEECVQRLGNDSSATSFPEQSTALCLRPFCEILKEILVQCSQLRNRSSRYYYANNVEKANVAASQLLSRLFLSLALSEGLNHLVCSIASSCWSSNYISVLFRRIVESHATFFGHMLENRIAIPAHPYLDSSFFSAESDLRQQTGMFERSVYFQACQSWAILVFNDTLAIRRASTSPASIVRSICESLCTMCLREQISQVSCCSAEFACAVLTEASKRLMPPYRFAIAAEIASIPALIVFLKMCNSLSHSAKTGLTLSQRQLVESADLFKENIYNLLLNILEDQITEPELRCLEPSSGRVSCIDMAGFLRLPQALFPDYDMNIGADVLKTLRHRFDTWKTENRRNHDIYLFLSRFFGRSCVPPDVQPIPPNAPSAFVEAKMLSELMSVRESFVRHVNSLRTTGVRAQDALQLHSQLKHFCDCSLFSKRFLVELQKYRNSHPSAHENDASMCSLISTAVLTYIETLFIEPNTTFDDVNQLVSTGSGAFSYNDSRTIEKEVAIVESWFSNAGNRDSRVDTERVKSASKILQYRNNVGEASGALKSLHLISRHAIIAMDEALGIGVEGRERPTLYDRLCDNRISLALAPKLLLEIEQVFHFQPLPPLFQRMEPSLLDILVHVEKAKAAFNFLKKHDVSERVFRVLWTNAESRAMGNPFITSVLDKLHSCRIFLQPMYKTEMDMAALKLHLSAYKDADKKNELIDQLNTVAQQWSSVEWYFHSSDNQATLALLGHFRSSGRFQSMGYSCPSGPAIKFCYRMGQTANKQ